MLSQMITIKEYAEQRGKSVQAVYQQMKSKENAAALDGHIHTVKINNKDVKCFDEEAVAILDRASQQSVQVVVQTAKEEEIEKLKERIQELEDRVERKDVIIEKLQERVEKKETRIEELEEAQLLIEEKAKKVDSMEKQVNEKDEEIKRLNKEVDSFVKGIFGFYWKKKEE